MEKNSNANVKRAIVWLVALTVFSILLLLSMTLDKPKSARVSIQDAPKSKEAAAAGCSQEEFDKLSGIGKVLAGEHSLRRIVAEGESGGKDFAGLFLFVGKIDERQWGNVKVKFCWQMNDGLWAISFLPLESFIIKVDDSVSEPTIKFRWNRGYRPSQVQHIMDYNVVYAVVTTAEKDWPIKISLPLAE